MNEKEFQNCQTLSVKKLNQYLRVKYCLLKKEYRNILKKQEQTPADKVLLENFLVLRDRYCDIKNNQSSEEIYISENGYPLLGETFIKTCKDYQLAATEEICKSLELIGYKHKIYEVECFLLSWSVMYTLFSLWIEKYSEINNDSSKQYDLSLFSKILQMMKDIKTVDWNKIMHRISPVDLIFQKDPSGIYTKMDSTTRALYCDYAMKISYQKGCEETEYASSLIDRAANASESYNSHIGIYLFEDYKKLRPYLSFEVYQTILATLTVLISFVFSWYSHIWWTFLLVFLPIRSMIKVFLDRFLSLTHPPKYIPRLKSTAGTPNPITTVITTSTLLSSISDVKNAAEKLESLFYSQKNSNMLFCLLCDLKPSSFPHIPEDEIIIDNLKQAVFELNQKYGDYFTAILRPRIFSNTEQQYIGWERKRGAIIQFAKLIRSADIENDDFQILNETLLPRLKDAKYMAVLDFDTIPMMDSISQLVQIAEHPLNSPVVRGGRIISGYGIIMPKITNQPDSTVNSHFSRMHHALLTSTAYDGISSEFYQDVFGESIFSGKGLIHIDALLTLCADYFPEDLILSHDILEGCRLRTLFVGDVAFQDKFPQSIYSWFQRAHRWIRGDVQNSIFINKTDTLLHKSWLKENIYRALSPIVLMISILLCVLPTLSSLTQTVLLFTVVISTAVPYLVSMIGAICEFGWSSLMRRNFIRTLPPAFFILQQWFITFLLLPQQIWISLDAVIRTIWRMKISKKHLLSWTTAAQADRYISSRKRQILYYLPAIIFSIFIFLFASIPALRFIGLFWCFMPLYVFYDTSMHRKNNSKRKIFSTDVQTTLNADLAAMWKYYEDFAIEAEHFLPPDNVQFAPIYRICHRTSPTNIGMMLVSILVAYDFSLISLEGFLERVDRTLASVEKLKKYHGNLYNWYDTDTLKLSANPFISSVDSGNFLCCLTALGQGINDLSFQHPKAEELYKRIQKIMDETDLSVFYDPDKKLFSVGIDPKTDQLKPNYYDMLMSEARMFSYFAIARRQVPKNHWKALSRTMRSSGRYSGAISYSGTMFEFLMPELFLKSISGSLSSESVSFCVYCQKLRGKETRRPFGVSESGWYTFDHELNYQYRAHGVQLIGVRIGLNDTLVVSPYSTYLALQVDFDSAYENLRRLRSYDAYGPCGYWEAIDFQNPFSDDAPIKGNIVKSYMAHHIGMSILAISNTLQNGRIQKLFLKDVYMKSAQELLAEPMFISATTDKKLLRFYTAKTPQKRKEEKNTEEYFDKFSPSHPNVKILTNKDYSVFCTDIGLTISRYQSQDIFAWSEDLFTGPVGCYFAIQTEQQTHSLSYLPDYQNPQNHCTVFRTSEVEYSIQNPDFSASVQISVHPTIPCEFRKITVKNLNADDTRKTFRLLSYMEPILCASSKCLNFPISSLLTIEYDRTHRVVFMKRRHLENERLTIWCAIGFLERCKFSYCFNREEVLSFSSDMRHLFEQKLSDDHISNATYLPESCVFFWNEILLQSHEERCYTFFSCTGYSKEEVIRNISILRNQPLENIFSLKKHNLFSENHLPEMHLATAILPSLLFYASTSTERQKFIRKNTLSPQLLHRWNITGEYPIVTLPIVSPHTDYRLQIHLRCYRLLKLSGMAYDLVILYKASSQQTSIYENLILQAFHQILPLDDRDVSQGVHLINLYGLSPEIENLFYASSNHVSPKSLFHLGYPTVLYEPLPILSAHSDEIQKFSYQRESVFPPSQTAVPWRHVLSNSIFGVVLSQHSLGFTWALNNRENLLTPRKHYSGTDYSGELLLLKWNENIYNLLQNSKAEFRTHEAIYSIINKNFSAEVIVSVSKTGFCKKIQLNIFWNCKDANVQIAYYTEPVLANDTRFTHMIQPYFEDNTLLLHNPANQTFTGWMAISSNRKITPITSKEAVFSGNWKDHTLSSSHFICGTVFASCHMKQQRKQSLTFTLSYAVHKEASKKMPKYFQSSPENAFPFQLDSPNCALNCMVNTWLPHQILNEPMEDHTDFGAYEPETELQKCVGAIWLSHSVVRQQILRCCQAQFLEGDMLKWRYFVPGKTNIGLRSLELSPLLWLAYAVCIFFEKSNDTHFLNISVDFSQQVQPINWKDNQKQVFLLSKANQKESVYQHCLRALNFAKKYGVHGLVQEKNDNDSENVWLTGLYLLVIKKFSQLAAILGKKDDAEKFRVIGQQLTSVLEQTSWDSQWYINKIFPDGTINGTSQAATPQIYLRPQCFAVFSQFSHSDHLKNALSQAYRLLVEEKSGIIKECISSGEILSVSSSDETMGNDDRDRQNTIDAIWFAMALLRQKDIEHAYSLIKMINPMDNFFEEKRFRTEKYRIPAYLYANLQYFEKGIQPFTTVTASWYYHMILGELLGFQIADNRLWFSPQIPSEWEKCDVKFQYQNTKICLHLRTVLKKECSEREISVFDNQRAQSTPSIPLDGNSHEVSVTIFLSEKSD